MTKQTKTKPTRRPKPKAKLLFRPIKPQALTKTEAITATKEKTKTYPYDVAKHLRTTEEMALYLEACIEGSDGDAAFLAKALGDVARAQGMSKVARDAGLSRESLYKALSGDRSPDFSTVLKVARALGMKVQFAAA